MRTAIALGNVVRVAVHVFRIAVVPLQRDLYPHTVLVVLEVKHRWVDGCLVAVQVIDEGANAPFILEGFVLVIPLVGQLDANTGVQER